MRFLEFSLLPESEKMRIIWMTGILIDEREEGSCRYELFQLEDFYVEQQFHYNVRMAIKSFKSCEQLEPYLSRIDISSLFSR